MVWTMRCFLLALILYFLYLLIKTTLTPNRRFRHAVKQERFYMLDDPNNVRKNILLTCKGAIFEGEKYLGTGKNSGDVVSIHIWARNPKDFEKIAPQYLFAIERKILKQYPNAKINWKNPFL
jgi:hypothetical protein